MSKALRNLEFNMRAWSQEAGCVLVEEDGRVESLTMGRIASFYYLKYQTLSVFTQYLQPGMSVQEVRTLPHSRDAVPPCPGMRKANEIVLKWLFCSWRFVIAPCRRSWSLGIVSFVSSSR